jgi:hypothetical protein
MGGRGNSRQVRRLEAQDSDQQVIGGAQLSRPTAGNLLEPNLGGRGGQCDDLCQLWQSPIDGNFLVLRVHGRRPLFAGCTARQINRQQKD